MTSVPCRTADAQGLLEWTPHLAAKIDRPSLAVLEHGSRVLGVHSSESDIDLLAITDGEEGRSFVPYEGTLLHVEYMPRGHLTTKQLNIELLERRLDVNIVHSRITTARILHDPDDVASSMVAAFTAWRPPQVVRMKLVGEILNWLADAVGALKAGRPESCELALRFLGHSLAKLSLLERGPLPISLKWQHETMSLFSPADLPAFEALLGLGERSLTYVERLHVAGRWLARWDEAESDFRRIAYQQTRWLRPRVRWGEEP